MDRVSQSPTREELIQRYTDCIVERVSKGYLPYLAVTAFMTLYCPSPDELAKFEATVYAAVPGLDTQVTRLIG